jgi:hypothetical protein
MYDVPRVPMAALYLAVIQVAQKVGPAYGRSFRLGSSRPFVSLGAVRWTSPTG